MENNDFKVFTARDDVTRAYSWLDDGSLDIVNNKMSYDLCSIQNPK